MFVQCLVILILLMFVYPTPTVYTLFVALSLFYVTITALLHPLKDKKTRRRKSDYAVCKCEAEYASAKKRWHHNERCAYANYPILTCPKCEQALRDQKHERECQSKVHCKNHCGQRLRTNMAFLMDQDKTLGQENARLWDWCTACQEWKCWQHKH